MKKLILLFLLLLSPLTVKAQDIPTQVPESGVYDPSGYLSQETINRIQEINNKYTETDLKPQIGFVVMDEIDGNIEQVANETARNWKIGFSGTNNGMLVMIDITNRKIRTETSNSLSTYITDYQTAILNDTVKQDFRNGDYDSGVNKYLDKYTEMMDKVVKGEPLENNSEKAVSSILSLVLIAALSLISASLIVALIEYIAGGGNDDDGGYYGGGSSSSGGTFYHHHYSSHSSYDSSSSSSSSSSSGWSGGGFGGGGSTGGW